MDSMQHFRDSGPKVYFYMLDPMVNNVDYRLHTRNNTHVGNFKIFNLLIIKIFFNLLHKQIPKTNIYTTRTNICSTDS